MTDEERILFMDWKNKNKDNIENVVITLLNYENGVDTKTCYNEVDWLIQKTFFAGLKAGRPQWHYPSKGDHPPSMEKYCGRSEPVLVWLGDNNVEYAQWIEEAKTWGRGICELTGTVIAWRYIELPKERI